VLKVAVVTASRSEQSGTGGHTTSTQGGVLRSSLMVTWIVAARLVPACVANRKDTPRKDNFALAQALMADSVG
jgi:hypothetical protein